MEQKSRRKRRILKIRRDCLKGKIANFEANERSVKAELKLIGCCNTEGFVDYCELFCWRDR